MKEERERRELVDKITVRIVREWESFRRKQVRVDIRE